MENYFIALFDIDWNGQGYSRGDIVTAAPGEGPASGAWANFEPVKGLCGQPELASIDDPGTGTLTFHYTVGAHGKRQKGFCVKARIGMPCAHVEEETPWSIREGAPPARAMEKPPELKYGASLAETAGRSFCGFVSKSNVKKTPIKEITLYDDPLHYGEDYDPLHRGED